MWLEGDIDNRRRLPLSPASAPPLFEVEFDDLMSALGPFEHGPILAIAVSGGPDSLALTLLAARWAEARNGRVIGLTIDHGLRPASSGEARQTGRWLKRRGIDHHILAWTGLKPETGVQHQARKARYDRLSAWCREAGILHLVTGHHRQDQAETMALRKARQSGPNGLACMAAIRDLHGLRLLRPLLGIDKTRLIATLDQLGQDWIEDPSNRNLKFTRNRLRHDGLDTENLAGHAADYGRERFASDCRLNAMFARSVTVDPAGFARVPEATFGDLPAAIAARLLERVLMAIGGSVYPPRSSGLQGLLAAMRHDRSFSGKTLAHCQIVKRKGDWLFCHERTPVHRSMRVLQEWQTWENRFLIRSGSEKNNLVVRQLGDDGWSMRRHLAGECCMRDLPSVVRATLPSIWQGTRLLSIPHAGLFDRSFDSSALHLKFRPSTPLANAPFAAHMCQNLAEATVALRHC